VDPEILNMGWNRMVWGMGRGYAPSAEFVFEIFMYK